MKALGISYKNAPLSVRERFSFDTQKRDTIRSALVSSVVICTCNRTEIYFTGADTCEAASLLTELAGIGDITEYLRIYENTGALRHAKPGERFRFTLERVGHDKFREVILNAIERK